MGLHVATRLLISLSLSLSLSLFMQLDVGLARDARVQVRTAVCFMCVYSAALLSTSFVTFADAGAGWIREHRTALLTASFVTLADAGLTDPLANARVVYIRVALV